VSDGCEEWRRWYWEELVPRSMIHTRQSPSVHYCEIFHLRNIFECTCARYNSVLFAVFFSLMFWVSQLINQNNATTFCIIKKYFTILQDISPRSNQTCTLKHLPINVSMLPSNVQLSPTQILNQWYFLPCPSAWLKIWVLPIAFYEIWRFCLILDALRLYNLNT